MIIAYTSNEAHAALIKGAAGSKGYSAAVEDSFKPEDFARRIEGASVLIFDLTDAAFSSSAVSKALDSVESEMLPPVLFILSSPADIELIPESESFFNQDYSFLPLEPGHIAARLEVLKLLGARRKLTMETAIHDRLTGLYNRKYFLRRLEEELYRSSRYGHSMGIMLLDVDFSAGDNKLTEESGTVVIRKVAEFFKDRLRRTDIVARYKWDDFAVLLPDIAAEDSLAVAQDIKAKLESLEITADELDISVKVAVGHVTLPSKGLASAVDVIGALEDCCFQAKADGSAGLVSFTADEQDSS
ncbi:diguanylate cyclase [bacterium]|nr:diguanylate cyclase [bacterium]